MDRTPKRVGKIYCSPACGMGCTHQAFVRVSKLANDLAAELGEGWQAEVWENLGWHWRVFNDFVEIHPWLNRKTDKYEYSAWLQTQPQLIGDTMPTVREALKDLKALIERRERELVRAKILIAGGLSPKPAVPLHSRKRPTKV